MITALKYTSAESIRNLTHDFLSNPAIKDLLREQSHLSTLIS